MANPLSGLFTVRGRISRRTDTIVGLSALLIVLIAWLALTSEFSPGHRLVTGIFLPSPLEIVRGTQDLVKLGYLPAAIWVSLWRIVQAMFFTVLVGVPIGIAMGSVPVVDSAFRRFVDGFKSVPPTAFIGLIILWFGIEDRAKVVFLFLGAIFYMIVMTRSAVLNVPEEYTYVATDIGATGLQLIWRVLVPGALPQIWDAIIVCNGLMWTYIVLAEWVNADSGLGFIINIASRQSHSDQVFAGIIVIALVSALTDQALRAVRARFLNW
ncbi:MAG TPA: ABC transporter permease [Chthonomonadaceae bacterium]|nr:ABC transporter permease [Chthonomonadaceae bacterium]